MQNYEASKPSYFATPSPQLVHALHTALTQILAGDLQDRFAVHRDASRRAKDGVEALGLRQLASRPDEQANGMTAVWLPDGINGKDLVAALSRRGLVIAAGLHKDHATKYIRFGHMGVSVTQKNRNDVDKILKALKDALLELGYKPTQSS